MPNINSHYVPQRFLRNFAISSEPGKIWRVDREIGSVRSLPIKTVAQSKNFYDDRTERWLSSHVEGPAWIPLDRLVRHQQLSSTDRLRVAEFLAVMFWRQMSVRDWTVNPLDSLKSHIVGMMLAAPSTWMSSKYSGEDEFVEAVNRWSKGIGSPPLNPNHRMLAHVKRDPWLTMVINMMSWRVVQIRGNDLLTGDSPMFFDAGEDPFHPEPEFSIALAPNVYMHGSWHQSESGKCAYVYEDDGIRDEINIRTAFWSVRYLFARRPIKYPFILPRESFKWETMTWTRGMPNTGKLTSPPYLSRHLLEETM